MGHPARPWLALLVSVLAHVAVALVLAGQASRMASHDGAGAGAWAGGSARAPLVVRLLPLAAASTSAAAHAAEAKAEAAAPAPALQLEEAVPARPATAAESPALAEHHDPEGTQAAAERHYFGPEATTQKPRVAAGMVAGKILVVPGITPQTVQLQVWISDEGAVERVALETPMEQQEEQMLLAAFAAVKFHPGRIGRIAVRSRLAMQVMLDYAIRM